MLKFGAISGIIFLILTVVLTFLILPESMFPEYAALNDLLKSGLVKDAAGIVQILILVSNFTFILGYFWLAQQKSLKVLKITAILLLIVSVPVNALFLYNFVQFPVGEMKYVVEASTLYSVFQIFFGIGILRAKDALVSPAELTAKILIGGGLLTATIFLSCIGGPLQLAGYVLMVVILFRESNLVINQ